MIDYFYHVVMVMAMWLLDLFNDLDPMIMFLVFLCCKHSLADILDAA
jgi:hypothetical protein